MGNFQKFNVIITALYSKYFLQSNSEKSTVTKHEQAGIK